MNLAKSNEVEHYDRKKLLRMLISIFSVVVTAVSAFVVVAAEANLRLSLQMDRPLPFLSLLGVHLGLILLFFGLNWDVYSDTRRDTFTMAIISIGALLPSALTGFSTHHWPEASRLVAMACLGFALGWSLSRGMTRRYGIQRSNLLSIVRTALSAALVLYATLAYILLAVAALEVR